MLLCRRCTELIHGSQRPAVASILSSSVPPWLRPLRRQAHAWKRRLIKQETLKDVVFQYATDNTKRADRVYVWGYAGSGALGVRSFTKPEKNQPPREKQFAPHNLTFLQKNGFVTKKVGCGYGFTVFICQLKQDSRPVVYGCGVNTDSQLGYQEYPKKSGRILDFVVEPASIELPLSSPSTTKLLDVACGRAHTLILTDKEGVFSLGNNAHGQCGRSVVPDEEYRGSQIINKISIEDEIVEVCCGQDHSMFLTADGQLYSCGLSADGQTGLGHYKAAEKPSKVLGDVEGEKITSVSSCADTVLAVSDKGDLFGWGNSEYGQLSLVSGDETQVNIARHLSFKDVGKVVKATAGGSMCALLNDKGDVYVWGFGILGKGPKLEHTENPERIPPTLFGRNEFNPKQKVVNLYSGISHFAALTENGELYMWGKNKAACLGLGNTDDQFFPFKVQVPALVKHVACGVDHTVALCKTFT